MAGNDHPAFQDGVPPEKGNARTFLPLRLGSANDLRALDSATFWLAFIAANSGWYKKDTGDTTSADNGASVIHDANGIRWKHVSFGVGSGLFDAYGEVGSPSDRDDYDAEDEGFTFYATDEEEWYVRVTDTPGTWAGPFTFGQGPQGDPGAEGDPGATGPTGPNVGLDYQWSTATSGDPTPGYVRGNNADPTAITSFAIDELDRQGENHDALIAFLSGSNSTVKATIFIIDTADRGNWLALSLTAAFQDQTGYWTGAVDYIDHAGTLANDAIVSVFVARTGNKGDDGEGSGDVSAASSLADDEVVTGDGGAKGVQTSGVTIADLANPDAAEVGFDPTGLANTDATDAQEMGEDFDAAIALRTSAAAVIGDGHMVVGDGGARGVQDSGVEMFFPELYGAVGDGSADDVDAINGAIDAAEGAGGGTVLLTKLYAVSESVVVKTGVRLVGDGWLTGLTLLNGSDESVVSVETDSMDFSIENMLIDGNHDGQTDEAVIHGIATANGTRFKIRGNKIVDCMSRCIAVSGAAANFEISDNYIDGAQHAGGIDLSTGTTATDMICTRNIVKNTQKANIGCTAIIARAVISHNICDTNGNGSGSTDGGDIGDCITAYNSANEHLTIEGNICLNSANHGIHVGGDYISVIGNTIDTVAGQGILIQEHEVAGCANVSVVGNSIETTAGNALQIATVVNGVVQGNSILNSGGFGILAQGGSTFGTISGNTIKTTANSGICLNDGAVGMVVDGNTVQGAAANHGIRVGVNGNVCSDNIVVNNRIFDNASRAIVEANSTVRNTYGFNNCRGNDNATGEIVLAAGSGSRVFGNISDSDPYGLLGGVQVFQSAIQATHTGDTSETVLATVTIPAGMMGPNGFINVRAMFSNNNSVGTKTHRVRWNGIAGSVMIALANTTSLAVSTLSMIANRNSASSQIMTINGQTGGLGISAGAFSTAAVNTASGDVTIVFTTQLSSGADNGNIEAYRVEVHYGA